MPDPLGYPKMEDTIQGVAEAGAFAIVGATGVVVNMGVLWALTNLGLYYLVASIIAIELSILNNFIWNDRWTFKGRRGNKLFTRVWRFHAVSVVGAAINWWVLLVLTQAWGIYYLYSNLIGILTGFLWNYLMNRRYTWGTVF